MRRLGPVVLALGLALPQLGCIEIVEANIRAIDTLGRSNATDEETGMAIAVVGGTAAFLAAVGVAATLTAVEIGGDEPPPPEVLVASELGWGLAREGDDVRWFRCTSRLLCTHERVEAKADAIVSIEPAGTGQPLPVDGATPGEQPLVRIAVRRRR